MIDEKKLIEILSKNSIFEKITNAEGKNIFEIIDEQPKTDCSECSIRKFYQQGYQDGLNADKWIPCEERLPIGEEYRKIFDGELYYKKVLTTTSEGRKYVGIYDTEDECWYDDNGFMFFPIAWQPIQPYKKEGAE